jgi:single-stranded-DNA-specific exonuclease
MEWRRRKPVKRIRESNNVIEKLAKVRGIDNIQEFLFPEFKHYLSPLYLKNIKEASEKILDALIKGLKIVISADCDTDGIMSTGMMVRFLSQFSDNVTYIYSQRSKGHGIEHQLESVPDDTDLLIILDSSSNSVKACKALKKKGIDIIILDHHQVEVENPYALLVNPQNDDYPNKSISGAGVTFKTMQVMDEKLGSDTVWDYIDLCAIGMYADMMDMSVMENRFIVKEGLKNIKNPGIRAILDVKNNNIEDVNSQTIGFTIAPMINGSARMEKIELALELVICDDYKQCLFLAEEIDKLNEKRKKITKQLTEQYMETIDRELKVIIAIDDQASKSFNGLVATKLADEFKRPAMVMRSYKGSLQGSYRNYADFNMQAFLRGCKDVLEAEGHTFAGGVKMFMKNYPNFLDYINVALANVEFESVIEYDLDLDVSDITEELIMEVEKFDFLSGTGFPSATFKVSGLFYDSESRQIIGKNKDTLKIVLDDITLMKFNVKDTYANDIPDMSEFEAVGQLNLNIWINRFGREYRNNQLFIEDYKII